MAKHVMVESVKVCSTCVANAPRRAVVSGVPLSAQPIITVTVDTHVEHSRHGRAYVFRGLASARLCTRYFRRGDGVWQTQHHADAARAWSADYTVAAHRKQAQ